MYELVCPAIGVEFVDLLLASLINAGVEGT